MTGRSWLEGVELLLVDGNNLLHRTAGGPGVTSARLLVPRLRSALRPDAGAVLVLDGMPDPGAPMREAVGQVSLIHAGRRSADDAIVELVERQPLGRRDGVTVVTDDRALADRVRRLGALHRRLDGLQTALDLRPRGPRAAGTGLGAGAPPRPRGRGGTMGDRPHGATADSQAGAKDADADVERQPWSPGRGATRKRGNPRRRRPPR